MGSSGYVHLDVSVILRETDKAFRVRLDDGREVWLPKSQIQDADDYAEGDENCTVSVTEWIASEKELE